MAEAELPASKNKDDLRRYMAESVLPNPRFLAIIVGGRPLSVNSLTILEAANDRCHVELGYVLEREWWGKGVATAVVRLATKAVMAEMQGLERVEALVDIGNKASQRVLEKVGFQSGGLLRRYWWNKRLIWDMASYSFTTADSFLI
ncbi:hypothetical protein KSP39_PZI003648 [Platanthera zijinensis]|uniref:N-acetyltransferase domain-containing protein n=1 Tax=Platanthera zijinensis TaxID=2320716 RepID=A0AAP0BYI7_9ASPA